MFVVGHRGAAGEAPENTIAGCLHAIERGVRHLEIDLQLSKDEQLVVLHDTTLLRTTGVRGGAARYTAAELKALDARRNAPPWPRKLRAGVPTLKALLRATPIIQTYQLEVKAGSAKTNARVADKLIEHFPDATAARRVIITCSEPSLHEVLRARAPYLRRGLVCIDHAALDHTIQLGCDLCVMHVSLANVDSARQLHDAGIAISCWTVNDPVTITQLHALKVQSVITDYPSMAVPLVAKLNGQKQANKKRTT